MPEPASLPSKVRATGLLNHPLLSAGRDGLSAVTTGAVESYGIVAEPLPVLPALSEQLPLAVPLPSGPEYVADPEQPASPDALSLPLKLTPTGRLYQPFA